MLVIAASRPEGKCISSKEEEVCSGYGMLGPAMLYMLISATPRCIHQGYSLLAFGSTVGGACQAAVIGMTSNGSIFSGVKVVVSDNQRAQIKGANGYLRPLFVPFAKARLCSTTVGHSLRPTVLNPKKSIGQCTRKEGQTMPYNSRVQLAPDHTKPTLLSYFSDAASSLGVS